MSVFHWKDSIFFERLADGSVRIFKTMGAMNDPVLFEISISGSEWCSIVAACSANGPIATSHVAARQLHLGKR